MRSVPLVWISITSLWSKGEPDVGATLVFIHRDRASNAHDGCDVVGSQEKLFRYPVMVFGMFRLRLGESLESLNVELTQSLDLCVSGCNCFSGHRELLHNLLGPILPCPGHDIVADCVLGDRLGGRSRLGCRIR